MENGKLKIAETGTVRSAVRSGAPSINALTVTLNPAMDRTLYLQRLRPGTLNRVARTFVMPGSKGINVSRVFRVLGAEAPALLFAGGDTGRAMCRILDGEGVRSVVVQTEAETRVNIKVIEEAAGSAEGGGQTELNEPGGPIQPREFTELLQSVENFYGNCGKSGGAYIFLGGSVPRGIDRDVYAKLIKQAAKRGARAVLDCDGEALRLGIGARPWLIKPNLRELEQFAGRELAAADVRETVSRVAGACREVRRAYGCNVLCTLGEMGAVWHGEDFAGGGDATYYCSVPKVELRGFTGAGDTSLTCFAAAVHAGLGASDALRFACAASCAKVTLPGTSLPDEEGMYGYMDEVRVERCV